jgi:hypothetical protein
LNKDPFTYPRGREPHLAGPDLRATPDLELPSWGQFGEEYLQVRRDPNGRSVTITVVPCSPDGTRTPCSLALGAPAVARLVEALQMHGTKDLSRVIRRSGTELAVRRDGHWPEIVIKSAGNRYEHQLNQETLPRFLAVIAPIPD